MGGSIEAESVEALVDGMQGGQSVLRSSRLGRTGRGMRLQRSPTRSGIGPRRGDANRWDRHLHTPERASFIRVALNGE